MADELKRLGEAHARIRKLEKALRDAEAAAKHGARYYRGAVGIKISREVSAIVAAALAEKGGEHE